jgi:hypothetical protein
VAVIVTTELPGEKEPKYVTDVAVDERTPKVAPAGAEPMTKVTAPLLFEASTVNVKNFAQRPGTSVSGPGVFVPVRVSGGVLPGAVGFSPTGPEPAQVVRGSRTAMTSINAELRRLGSGEIIIGERLNKKGC